MGEGEPVIHAKTIVIPTEVGIQRGRAMGVPPLVEEMSEGQRDTSPLAKRRSHGVPGTARRNNTLPTKFNPIPLPGCCMNPLQPNNFQTHRAPTTQRNDNQILQRLFSTPYPPLVRILHPTAIPGH